MRTQKIILLGLLLLFQSARAAEIFGTVEAVAGTATLANENGATSAIVTGTRIYAGQSMLTGNDGEVHIVTTDSSLIALRPDSRLHIDQYQAQGKATDEIVFSLLKGALRSITGWIAKRNPEAYRLHVATTTMGVRGTDHETTLVETTEPGSPPGVYDTVYEGSTVMQTTRGSIEVHAGKFGFVPRDATQPLVLLERRPLFMQHRTLRLEQRLQQRKEALQQTVQNRLHDLTSPKANERNSAARHDRAKRARREMRLRQLN